MLDEVIF